jgi:hypothetical protein
VTNQRQRIKGCEKILESESSRVREPTAYGAKEAGRAENKALR